MKLWALSLILLSFSARALETDNYLMWNRTLDDSSSQINQYVNEQMRLVLETSKDLTCDQVTDAIGARFRSHLVHDNPIELWLMSVLKINEVYPQSIHYVEQSIYRDPYLIYIPAFGLAPNIQVSDYYFGMDKLSHFASVGKDYHSFYQKVLQRGGTEEEALEAALMHGVRDERRVHGYWSSGVFSFADMEANYQGFLFYKNLCTKNLEQVSGKWMFKKEFDISEYVDGFWDESFYLSYRLPSNWKKVSKNLKEYCSHAKDSSVLQRFDYYQATSVESESVKFLRGDHPDVPHPEVDQSFTNLCLYR